ncbi:MAG: EamA family transporter [Anaerolineales bacterium]|nr:EamA family transporter [Anaerolineales bacterium]
MNSRYLQKEPRNNQISNLTQKQDLIIGFSFATLSAACIGGTYLFSKVALSTTNTRSFISIWMLMGAVYVFAAAIIKRKLIFPQKRSIWLGLISLGLFEIISSSAFFTAISLASQPAIVAFLARFTSLFGLIMSVIILKERMNLTALAGTVIILVGGFSLSYVSGTIGWTLLLLNIIMSISVAASLIVGKVIIEETNPYMMLLFRNVITAIGTFLILPGPFEIPPLSTLGVMAVGAFIGPFLGFLFLYMALDHIDAWMVSIFTMTQPLFVALYDWAFLGSVLTWTQLLAGIVILLGTYLIIRSSIRHALPPSGP